MPQFVHYLPIVSSVIAASFTVVLYRHWKRRPGARYLMWWMIGVALFGVGTFTEAMNTLIGWTEPNFRAWYISGALLGGAPLAQGTVYLVHRKRIADRLTIALIVYVAIAAIFVLTTPIDMAAVDPERLSGRVMEWTWVRAFSPLVNLYALVYLVGGAIWSAYRYSKRADRPKSRVQGNWLIAIGALLPGIGGTFTRFGHVEVLYVAELIGLTLIWLGYRTITSDTAASIHAPQRQALSNA